MGSNGLSKNLIDDQRPYKRYENPRISARGHTQEEKQMRKLNLTFSIIIFVTVMMFTLTGCSLIFQSGRRQDIEKIANLQDENQRLANEKSELERA